MISSNFSQSRVSLCIYGNWMDLKIGIHVYYLDSASALTIYTTLTIKYSYLVLFVLGRSWIN